MTTSIFFRNIIYIIVYKVASIINSSYYATLINNMAMGFPHSIPKCNAIAICLQKWRHRGRGLLKALLLGHIDLQMLFSTLRLDKQILGVLSKSWITSRPLS